MIETDRIISPEGEEQEKRFDRAIRPLSLEDYVGQEIVRNQMQIFISAASKRNEPLDHTFFIWASWSWKDYVSPYYCK